MGILLRLLGLGATAGGERLLGGALAKAFLKKLFRWGAPIATGIGLGSMFSGGSEKQQAIPPQLMQQLLTQPQGMMPMPTIQPNPYEAKMSAFLKDVSNLLRNTKMSPNEMTIALDILGKMVAPMMPAKAPSPLDMYDIALKQSQARKNLAQALSWEILNKRMMGGEGNAINPDTLSKVMQLQER